MTISTNDPNCRSGARLSFQPQRLITLFVIHLLVLCLSSYFRSVGMGFPFIKTDRPEPTPLRKNHVISYFMQLPMNQMEKMNRKSQKREGDPSPGEQPTKNNPPFKKRITTSKPKAWRKPKDMPRRPLSAYNFFFQSARRRMLQENAGRSRGDDSSGTGGSDKPRGPTHGLGFAELARVIAKQWRSLEGDERKEFQEKARIDKIRYKRELKQWKKSDVYDSDEESEETAPPALPNQGRAPVKGCHPQQGAVNPIHQQSSFQPTMHTAHLLHSTLLHNDPQSSMYPSAFSVGSPFQNHHGPTVAHQLFNQHLQNEGNNPPNEHRGVVSSLHPNLLMHQRQLAQLEQSLLHHQSQLRTSQGRVSNDFGSHHLAPAPARHHPDEQMHGGRSPFDTSWADLAVDILKFPCDTCFSPQEHDARHAAAAEENSINDDIIAMLKGSPPESTGDKQSSEEFSFSSVGV